MCPLEVAKRKSLGATLHLSISNPFGVVSMLHLELANKLDAALIFCYPFGFVGMRRLEVARRRSLDVA